MSLLAWQKVQFGELPMKVQGTHYRSIWYDYKDCQVKIIDQRWLPHDFRIVALQI